jgi:glycerophosphoryl diester phosphodiesterase
VLASSIAATLLLLEQAGILAIAHFGRLGARPPLRQFLWLVVHTVVRVAKLGAVKAILLLLVLVPFVLIALGTYLLLLSGHDIYFYVTNRPPVFWLAASLGLGLLLLAAAVAGGLYIRWAFALPILLFENQSPRFVLRQSAERVRGAARRIGGVLIGWPIVVLLATVGSIAAFRWVAERVLRGSSESPWVWLALLTIQASLVASLSAIGAIGQALFTDRLYRLRTAQLGRFNRDPIPDMPELHAPAPMGSRRWAWVSLVLFLLSPVGVWATVPFAWEDPQPVDLTAHRGHSRAAPENTLAAIRQAIASGVEYAEIDVHQTADGVLVLLHDRDLKRVAGDSRRLDELTLDEVRQFDVGSWFAPEFAGERVPTLAEAIELARGKIKLNIELKYFGPDQGLAAAAAAMIADHHFESQCLVTSFNADALQLVKRHNPRILTGLIVARALGDLHQLEVDAFSVQASRLTDELLRNARRAGKQIHVWTVNDPAEMLRMMNRGVNNIITSDPDLAIQVRRDWLAMSDVERLQVASRVMLGLNP